MTMTDKLKGLLMAIKEAIKAEQQAKAYYQSLAEDADDPALKSLFEQLSRDEDEHERLLRFRYESLKKACGEE